MSRFSSHTFATIAFAVFASAAYAQAPGASSLQQLCPGAADQLADRLDRVAREHREVSNVFVSFDVQYRRISNVSLFGADATYQRAVKQALRGLHCTGASGDDKQQAQFVVQFAVPPAVAATPASAPVAMRR